MFVKRLQIAADSASVSRHFFPAGACVIRRLRAGKNAVDTLTI
jgi:hypothetical protein